MSSSCTKHGRPVAERTVAGARRLPESLRAVRSRVAGGDATVSGAAVENWRWLQSVTGVKNR